MSKSITNPRDFWTPYKVEVLKHFWGREPSRQIAERLGATKNMVISKAYRMKLDRLKGYTSEWDAVLNIRPLYQMPMVKEPEITNPRLATGNTRCHHEFCTNTAQPSRAYCAEHLREKINEWNVQYAPR